MRIASLRFALIAGVACLAVAGCAKTKTPTSVDSNTSASDVGGFGANNTAGAAPGGFGNGVSAPVVASPVSSGDLIGGGAGIGAGAGAGGGIFVDENGNFVDANGNRVDANGNPIGGGLISGGSGGGLYGDGSSGIAQSTGTTLFRDANGNLVDANGNRVDEFGNPIGTGSGLFQQGGQGQYVDQGGSTVSPGAYNFSGDDGSPTYFAQRVGDRILFDTDSSTIDGDSQEVLRRQAAWFKQHPSFGITIEGHADERGTRDYNLALGARRANSVQNYLISLGINPARIRTVSYGKERPVRASSTPGAWRINRRAVSTLRGGPSS